MTLFIDARIPVLFDAEPGPEDAVLPPLAGAAAHPAGCACCVARTPVAQALDVLFQQRVRGTIPWFRRLIAGRADEAAVRAALEADPLTAARFRLG